ncbi:MAG: hypothetical protein JW708_10605 [Vallitaleaceae bacterium]|nr:hypothetical protein [Vallitaleaceae bacterium]
MSMKPLDLQVMVPKLQEVAAMKQMENHRIANTESLLMNAVEKNIQKDRETVSKTAENQSAQSHMDAKEEGSNNYTYSKKSLKKAKKTDDPPPDESYHKIDIKV